MVNQNNVHDYLVDPPEYTFIDSAVIAPGECGTAIKKVRASDWYMHKCNVDIPVMPFPFVLEAIMQTGALIVNTIPGITNKLMLFHGCECANMYKRVVEQDEYLIHCYLKFNRHGVARFNGVMHHKNGESICDAWFTLINDGTIKMLQE